MDAGLLTGSCSQHASFGHSCWGAGAETSGVSIPVNVLGHVTASRAVFAEGRWYDFWVQGSDATLRLFLC